MTNHEYRPVDPEAIETDDFGRVTDRELRLWEGHPPGTMQKVIPVHVGMEKRSIICQIPNGERTPAFNIDQLYTRHEVEPDYSQMILDAMPGCVPDGWWVYRYHGIWASSEKQPRLQDRTEHGWCANVSQINLVRLNSRWFPNLYDLEIPIEHCCVQVVRESDPIEGTDTKPEREPLKAGWYWQESLDNPVEVQLENDFNIYFDQENGWTDCRKLEGDWIKIENPHETPRPHSNGDSALS